MQETAIFEKKIREAILANDYSTLRQLLSNHGVEIDLATQLRIATMVQRTGRMDIMSQFFPLNPNSHGTQLSDRDWVVLQEICLRNLGDLYPETEDWVPDVYKYDFSEVVGGKKYIAQNNLASALTHWQWIENSQRFLQISLLEDSITSALSSGTPFSFIRIGDGEGRFLDRTYPTELNLRIKFIAQNIWFWNSRCYPPNDFFDRLKNAYCNADVIGVNPGTRLSMEYYNSLVGYCGVLQGNKFALTETNAQLIENHVNVIMDNRQSISKWITAADRVVFISPHAGFPANRVLAGKENVSYFILAPEHNEVMRELGSKSPHYPDLYEDICKRIRDYGPALYIVGGGVFGKIYCDVAKLAGGVALDVGALVDLWAGYKTR